MGQFCLKMLNLTISVALLLTFASSSYGGVTRDTSGFSAFGYSAPDDTFQSASAGFSGFGYSAPASTSVSASAGVSAFGFTASATPSRSDTVGSSGFGFTASATPSRSATVGGSAFGFTASATPSRSDTVGGSAFGFTASASTLSPAFKEQLTALYDLANIMEGKSERFLERIEETDTLDRRARSILRNLKNIVFDSFEILSEEEEGENWNKEFENLLDAVQEMVDMF